MEWDGMRGLEWKWIRGSVIELVERKNGMGIDVNEWIESIKTNYNKKQRRVVMRVNEVKQNGKEDGIMNRRV